MKGLVVIYTVPGCPHCRKAKTILDKFGLDFREVSVDKYPNIVKWLRRDVGVTRIPQVFFNDKRIGGIERLEELAENESEFEKVKEVLDDEVPEEGMPLLPTEQEEKEAQNIPASGGEGDPYLFGMCSIESDYFLLKKLRTADIFRERRVGFLKLQKKRCTSGAELLAWLKTNADNERVMAIADDLLQQGQVVRMNGSTAEASAKFEATESALYQLVEDVQDNILNGGIPPNCSPTSPTALSEEIRNQILALYSKYLSSDGKFVDYNALVHSNEFKDYRSLVRRLQTVDLSGLTEQERKAFFINVYNALVIHSTTAKGPPKNDFQRWKFYKTSCYLINGNVFSLDNIEHGILRANKKGVGMLTAPFGRSDPRRAWSLKLLDPRIHFALNCGAKSCPPIKTFTAENLDEELELATESFLDSPDSFELRRDKKEIALSMLFKWFASDFGSSKVDILKWMHARVVDKDRQGELGEAINGNFSVTYLPYNWDLNGNFEGSVS